MTEFIPYIGALLLMSGAYLVGREYSEYVKRRIGETEGIILLAEHIRSMIDKFLSFGEELYSDFHNSALDRSGFLAELRSGIPDADLNKLVDKLSVSVEVREVIIELFLGLGQDYREGELKRIEMLKEKLVSLHKKESLELEKSLKLTRALLLGGALVAVILGI